jgi:hypothetical protein
LILAQLLSRHYLYVLGLFWLRDLLLYSRPALAKRPATLLSPSFG